MTKPHSQPTQGSARPLHAANPVDVLPLEKILGAADIGVNHPANCATSQHHQLQKGWSWISLKSLGEIMTGRTPPTSSDCDLLNLIPFITPAEITGSFNGINTRRWFNQEYRDLAKLVPTNSILMVCIGSGGIGKCSLTDREVGFNQQINALVVNQAIADPSYVLAACLSPLFKKQLSSKTACTAIPILNLSSWGELEIPLPQLPKQQRIGALFKELDRNLSLNRAQLTKLTQLKTSMLEQMFPQEGEDVPRLRFDGFTEPWQKITLNEASSNISDGVHNLPAEAKEGEGIPILSAKDIDDFGNILFNDVARHASYQSFQSELKRNEGISFGDVLITIVGSIGRAAIVNTDRRFMLQRSVAIIKPQYSKIRSEYLRIIIAHPSSQIWLNETAAGSTQKGIYLNKLSSMAIMAPSLAEQEHIGAFFKALDERLALQRAKIAKLEQLKKALLEQMFV